MSSSLLRECGAEVLGTWLLVFVGTATGAASVTTGMQVGIWQVAVVWGFLVALSTFLTMHISGAHLNPAVTIALAWSREKTGFPAHKVLPYIAAQVFGAMLSGVCLLSIYGNAIARFEKLHSITRGEANSTLSAMIFCDYFPNPQLVHSGVLEQEDVSPFGALVVEAVGTMILMLLVRSLTDETNHARPSAKQAPFFIGFTVSSLVGAIAPLSQAGFNPARDFGPRLVVAMAGWSSIGIPGPQNGFWVYIVGPIIGALIGGHLFDVVVQPAYVATTAEQEESKAKLLDDDELQHSKARMGAYGATLSYQVLPGSVQDDV